MCRCHDGSGARPQVSPVMSDPSCWAESDRGQEASAEPDELLVAERPDQT
jgi:hypothetical protein